MEFYKTIWEVDRISLISDIMISGAALEQLEKEKKLALIKAWEENEKAKADNRWDSVSWDLQRIDVRDLWSIIIMRFNGDIIFLLHAWWASIVDLINLTEC